ncbi:MAG: M48 family metalloprotease [Acidobacteriota bacterium]
MKMFRLAAIPLFALLVTSGCATNPATGKSQLSLIGEQQEIAMGRQADEQVSTSLGLYDDQEAQEYVSRIGLEMAAKSERPNLPWSFKVVDDPVVNAFALPGGFIYVTRGILAHMNNEAELAAVLGHEIGHVTGRHSVSRMSKAQLATLGLGIGSIVEPSIARAGDLLQTGLGLLFLKYSRNDERQADDLGLRYLGRTGYDAREMIGVFEMLGAVSQAAGGDRIPGWLATHPQPENRRARIAEAVATMEASEVEGEVRQGPFYDILAGMTYGADPRQGYFEGSTFYHPEMAFRLDFPAGWKTANQRQQVVAMHPDQNAILVLRLAPGGNSAEAERQFYSSQQGVRRGNSLGNIPAALRSSGSYFSVPRQQASNLVGLTSFIEHRDLVFQVLGYTLEERWSGVGDSLRNSVATFSRVTDPKVLNVQPAKIEIVTLPQAAGLDEIQRRWPSNADLRTLALINRVDPNATLPAGTRFKRVVGGR